MGRVGHDGKRVGEGAAGELGADEGGAEDEGGEEAALRALCRGGRRGPGVGRGPRGESAAGLGLAAVGAVSDTSFLGVVGVGVGLCCVFILLFCYSGGSERREGVLRLRGKETASTTMGIATSLASFSLSFFLFPARSKRG